MRRRPKRNYPRGNKSAAALQRKIIRSFLILGGIALVIIFIFGDHGVLQLYHLRSERAEIQAHINSLREKRIELDKEKHKLETDYNYIEQLAREKFRMAKRGEKVFKVIEKDSGS
jgi:cell division protein FtsB